MSFPQNVPFLLNPDEKRNCTDVLCLIIGFTFSLIMFIIAISTFNYSKYNEMNFPADSAGTLCGIDKPGYEYVYFVNPPQMVILC